MQRVISSTFMTFKAPSINTPPPPMLIYCRGKSHRQNTAFDKHTYHHSLVLKCGSGEFKCHCQGGVAALGPQLCVSESDLVPCHTELQACLEAKFSLEGHETPSEERLHLSCTSRHVLVSKQK